MRETKQKLEPPELSSYDENRANFPLEELAKYAGKYIAFSPDGTRILASGDTEEEMERNLAVMGIDPSQVVGSYVNSVDSVLL